MASPHAIPLPADFGDTAARMSVRKLCAHYGVCKMVVMRWRKEIGTAPDARVTWSQQDREYVRAHYATGSLEDMAAKLGRSVHAIAGMANQLGVRRQRNAGWFNRDRKPNVSGRVQSFADMAAAFIRAHDRTAIYRCDSDGQANPKGGHWKYGHGSLVLTEAELFAKAERKGWQRDEWKKLAA